MQELADVGVVGGTPGRGAGAAANARSSQRPRPRAAEVGAIDVDHRGVRAAQLVEPGQGFAVDLLGDGQTVAAGRGQADQLLEPRRAGRLQVEAGVELRQRRRIGP